ncbi:TPA: peptidoglycan-binding domain-containing protein [Yersinia enterocolitica]|nr:peptidoglycan-binding domain-containing protein [Yersinia enterocolitica]HEI6803561.1 peptidoglycan-binding domain-containing protein [Yersinia enterocolitica]HEI6968701.1 peptidoglycan-binding domain-containing protein [Yersinia enterocolitica]
MKEISGEKWVSRFQGSASTRSLSPSFKISVDNFISELTKSGATIVISATLRPPERAYLMHWSWKISRNLAKPEDVPEKTGISIQWAHKKSDGSIDTAKSIKAAQDMVRAYGMTGLNVAPSLKSRHTEGNAIDMNISWMGDLKIKNKKGEDVLIKTFPKDGMNTELHTVGKSFGIIKYHGGSKDRPHWSTDGR